jgi:hypothetical protein
MLQFFRCPSRTGAAADPSIRPIAATRAAAMPRNRTGPAWPPPTPPLFALSYVLPGPGPDWHAELKARDAARHEESLRVIAHYKERDRQREEREAAEARADDERQRERLRRQGWPI